MESEGSLNYPVIVQWNLVLKHSKHWKGAPQDMESIKIQKYPVDVRQTAVYGLIVPSFVEVWSIPNSV